MFNIAMLFCWSYFVFFSHTPLRRSTGLSCLQRRNNEPRCVISRWCLHVLHRAGHPGAASPDTSHDRRCLARAAYITDVNPGDVTRLPPPRRQVAPAYPSVASPRSIRPLSSRRPFVHPRSPDNRYSKVARGFETPVARGWHPVDRSLISLVLLSNDRYISMTYKHPSFIDLKVYCACACACTLHVHGLCFSLSMLSRLTAHAYIFGSHLVSYVISATAAG